MLLDAIFQGKFVPVNVRLSPPRRFKSVVGTIDVAVHPIVVATRAALLLTRPVVATSEGR